jgi:hypothetical protein
MDTGTYFGERGGMQVKRKLDLRKLTYKCKRKITMQLDLDHYMMKTNMIIELVGS